MQYKRIDTRTLKIWSVDTDFQQAQRVAESIQSKK